jgi:hypothetical protein
MSTSCVVIPIYKGTLSALERISLTQMLRVLARHDLFIVSPEGLEMDPGDAALVSGVEIARFSPWYFKAIRRYNRLLMAKRFYRRFARYDSLLIAHLDSFVFADHLDDWAARGFGTIGAPWFEGWSNPAPDSPLVGVGNGGFCLRNIEQCLRVLTTAPRRLRSLSQILQPEHSTLDKIGAFFRHYLVFNYNVEPFLPRLNEDIFWSTVAPAHFPQFTVPTIEEAIAFAFEVRPEHLYELNGRRLPFGCHGWWRYNPEFWRPFIEREGYRLESARA